MGMLRYSSNAVSGSGGITLTTGSTEASPAGSITLQSGNAEVSSAGNNGISLAGGNVTKGIAPNVRIAAGTGNQGEGSIELHAGQALKKGGDIKMESGNGEEGGSITFTGGKSFEYCGEINLVVSH